jgi:two-component system, NarL family, response regulator LiaR
MVREGLRAVIAQEPDLVLVGEAADGGEAVIQARQQHPDVILMDLLMPGMSGGEAVAAIIAQRPTQQILLLTSVEDIPTLLATIRAGATGYVSKNAPPSTLLEAIRAVHRGSVVLPTPIARALLHAPENVPAPSPPPLAALTDRELEVLRLVARGLDNEAIGAQLSISPRTVSVHVSHILNKLDLNNRTQAALCALRSGLVGLL